MTLHAHRSRRNGRPHGGRRPAAGSHSKGLSSTFSDSSPIRPVSYSYSLDGGPAGSVPGQTGAIDLAAPGLGSHTLTVSAIDAYGVLHL
jgi:hypothetical protein